MSQKNIAFSFSFAATVCKSLLTLTSTASFTGSFFFDWYDAIIAPKRDKQESHKN